jgi:protein kinase A
VVGKFIVFFANVMEKNHNFISESSLVFGRYSIIKQLQTALYGKVMLVKDQEDGKHVVVKALLKKKIDKGISMANKQIAEDVDTEVWFMKEADHLNLLPLIREHEDEDVHLIVLPYAKHGDLVNVMNEMKGSFPEERAKRIFLQIVDGLEYMHDHCFAHRDISLENILMFDDDVVKISDFGLVAYFGHFGDKNRDDYKDEYGWNKVVGKRYYMAPEVYLLGKGENKCYDYRADFYSLGVILFVMLAGVFPYNRASMNHKPYAYIQKHGVGHNFKNKNVSQDAIDLINGLIRHDPDERFTFREIYKSKFCL